jgi:hypothetical protein
VLLLDQHTLLAIAGISCLLLSSLRRWTGDDIFSEVLVATSRFLSLWMKLVDEVQVLRLN